MTPSLRSSSSTLTSQERVDLDLASFTYELGMTLPTLGTNRWTSLDACGSCVPSATKSDGTWAYFQA